MVPWETQRLDRTLCARYEREESDALCRRLKQTRRKFKPRPDVLHVM